MDQAAVVRAVEVLMSPLEWETRGAWLAESLRLVREARGVPAASTDTLAELEALLRLPGDEPGWLRTTLDAGADEPLGAALAALSGSPAISLEVVSLRCGLAAGLTVLGRLRGWRSALGHAFDDVDTGMAIFGQGGRREIARNLCLSELLEEEPEQERLQETIARRARHAAAPDDGPPEHGRDLELAGGHYRLAASRVAAGMLLPEPAVLVLVDRLTPGLPTTRELRVAFGLRGREPQVALLAAEGLSNAAIAERLRLSAHTVRHYLERVLDRLGLHSRKALALRLMAGGAARGQTPERKSS